MSAASEETARVISRSPLVLGVQREVRLCYPRWAYEWGGHIYNPVICDDLLPRAARGGSEGEKP